MKNQIKAHLPLPIYSLINYTRRKYGRNWQNYVNSPSNWVNKHFFYEKKHLRDSDINEEILKFYRKDKYFLAMSSDRLQEIRNNIQLNFPDSYQKTVMAADLIYDKTFKLLGVGSYHFNGKIDWSSDLKGGSWRKGKYSDLTKEIYSGFPSNKFVIGDIKVPWELNKHLFFFDLARAFVLTGDDKYVYEFRKQLESWWEENPVEMNLAWLSPLIVAHRAIAWIFAMRFFINSSVINGNFFIKFLASLYNHLEWIQWHYELWPLSTNHLFGNLAGVLVITTAFPQFDIAAKSETKALRILEEQLSKQVYSDGMQYEQSVSYHRYVLEFIYAIILSSIYAGKPLLDNIMKPAQNMAEYLLHVIAPNGMANLISDADGAYVYKFDTNHINDYRPHLALGSVLFNRPDFAHQSQRQNEIIIWTLGPRAKLSVDEIPRVVSKWFDKGGIVVLRNGWDKNSAQMTFDCGNIGMGYADDHPHASHGHDDLLSYTLAYNGEQIFVDKGSGSYTGDPVIHDALRSSLAHNTISLSPPCESLDEAEKMIVESHSILCGTWTLEKRASPLGAKFMSSEGLEYTSCAHDGYRRFINSPVFRRSILHIHPKIFIILDSITSRSQKKYFHKMLMPFHFYPGTEVEYDTHIIRARRNNAAIECFIKDSGNNWRINLYNGNHKPYRGWFAEDYGKCVPAHAIDYESIIPLPFSLALVFNCYDIKENQQHLRVNWIDEENKGFQHIALQIEIGRESFSIVSLPKGADLIPSRFLLSPHAEFAVLKYSGNNLEKVWIILEEYIKIFCI